jgi:aminoglycoside 6'-N-acetyltransferase I
MKRIEYLQFEDSDFDQLLNLSQKLWKDYNEAELKNLLKQIARSDKNHILIAKDSVGNYAGFSIFSIRTDYVEGAEKSPTGYLEGIFVEAEFRNMGIAKEFMRRGELWCKEKGCTQIGSDTWLTDKESRKFHKTIGFREQEELVHFLKDLK